MPAQRPYPTAGHAGGPARYARSLAASVAAVLLALACGGDAAQSPTTPEPTTPEPPASGPSTPTTPAPSPTGAKGERAELETLYGTAAPRVADAVAARRRTADSLLAAAAVDVAEAAVAAAGAVIPAVRPALPSGTRTPRAFAASNAPRETATTETVTADGRSFRIDTRAVSQPAFDAATATLRLTQDFVVAVTPVGASGRAYRQESSYAFDLPACPAADGTSSGRLLAVSRSWQRTSAPAGEGADSLNADRRRETRVDGEVLLRVNDGAEVAGVDLTLNVGAAWDDGTGTPRRGTGRLVWPGAPVSVFVQAYDPARLSAKTGDLEVLDALGYGPGDRYALAMEMAGQQVQAARVIWRGGRCVEVVLARGYTERMILPGSTVQFGPEAKSRLDRTTVAPAMLLARAEGGTVSPLAQVPHPATFDFTMPDAPAMVEFRATSRRGIGTLRLPFLRDIPDTATIRYVATSSYAIDQPAASDGSSQTAAITGRMEVTSRVRFVFDRASGDARYYKVIALNRIAVAGQASVDARQKANTSGFTMEIAGADSTHSPRAESDPRTSNGYMWYPDGSPPGTRAGTLKVTLTKLRYTYELDLGVGQIVPDFTYAYKLRSVCTTGVAETTERYENRSRVRARVVTDTPTCRHAGVSDTRTEPASYSWGAIYVDRSRPSAETGSGALVSGTWAVGAPTPTGQESREFTNCTAVLQNDPTQVGSIAAFYARPPQGMDWSSASARCRLQYTLSWTLPLP